MPLRRMQPLVEPAPVQVPTFEAVCRTHTPQIARWAQRLGGPRVDVEEAVQDVLLIVARRLGEFRGDAKLTTWLFRITARVAANHRRAGSRRRVWGRLTRRIEETAPIDGPEPGADLEAEEARAQFYRALDALPERHRQVLILVRARGTGGRRDCPHAGTSGRDRPGVVAPRARGIRRSLAARQRRGRKMSSPIDRDPPRWRDGLPPAADGDGRAAADVERAIGAASRSVAAAPGPDELRLAQVRQRAVQDAERLREATLRRRRLPAFFGWEGGRDGRPWGWSGWVRLAAVVLASLLVGGVATAVTGRLIQHYGSARTPSTLATTRADDQATKRGGRPRRWRVSVKAPTDLELAIGPDGAEIAVVEGEANMSGEGITDSVAVVPGRAWKEGAAAAAVPPTPTPAPPLPAIEATAPPVRTLARSEAPFAKAHVRGPRPTVPMDGEVGRTSSEGLVEAPVPSPLQPPPLPPLALSPARARPAKSTRDAYLGRLRCGAACRALRPWQRRRRPRRHPL